MTISVLRKDTQREDAQSENAAEYEVIGKPIIRESGAKKVTGAAKFTTDISKENMLHGKILFSNRPHARILNIDVSKAAAIPGVEAIITGDDVPDTRYGQFILDRPVLAKERVRYIGEPVAAVAARSKEIARKAVGLIEVSYEDLPAVFDPEDSLKKDSYQIHPGLQDYSAINPYVRYGNVCMDARVSQGDPDTAFAEAERIVENTFKTQGTHQGYLEPHSCISYYDHTGRLSVVTGTQQLSIDHASLARVLELPLTRVRVESPFVGGAFGGKLNISIEPICCLLTKASRKAVKITLTREEEFFTQHPRAPFIMKLRTGICEDGTIVAQEVDIVVDAGAYVDQSIGIATKAAFSMQGSYHIPHCRARTRAVYTNNIDWGCMRGYGTIQMTYAIETQLDLIADEIGMDPADIRMNNLCREGDKIISGQTIHGIHVRETMQKALEVSDYRNQKENLEKNIGIGIANVNKTSGLLSSSASIRANEDATLSINTAIVDMGTGAHTVFRQIAAEVLQLPVDQISISRQDSDFAPYDFGSQASRTVYNSGNAVRIAAEDLQKQLVSVAAATMQCDPSQIIHQGGTFFLRESTEQELGFEELVGASLYSRQGPLIGHGSYMSTEPVDDQAGEGFFEHAYPAFTFSTQIAVVEVDPGTGKIKICDFTSCHDIGKAINPTAVEGQIEGAIVQGLGFGIYEEMIMNQGRVLNPNLVDYRMPTILDAIDIHIELIEIPDEKGPFGAKGIGEGPMIGVAPAIANAIFDATGVMVRELPIYPERLYFEIQKKKTF